MEGFRLEGFLGSAIRAGVGSKDKLDLALIYSEEEASVAGVFTKNKIKAAPVLVSQAHLRMNEGKARAIVANSGNANACTGNRGVEDSIKTAQMTADGLGIDRREVLIASTGVIGKRLDMDAISRAMPKLIKGLSDDGLNMVAEAIMTTDTFPKMSLFKGDGFKIVGIAKGAGMIMPEMATMLCFILTDVSIDPESLKSVLAKTVEKTFNRISVDGETSTNDTVIIMANGIAGKKDMSSFSEGLTVLCNDLANMIVRDGEGASKIVDVIVKGAETPSDALNAARVVANSNLVKTAIHGEDPNWGRIMAALGRSDINLEPEYIDIWIEDVQIVSNGQGIGAEVELIASERMKKEEFNIIVDLKKGPYQDHVLTCDLTHEYISLNADYRT